MKSIVVLFLFSTILLANTELTQLMAVPALVKHYLEHKSEFPNESVFQYLTEHYCENMTHSHNDAKSDHDNLPFKSGHCSLNHIVLAILIDIKFDIFLPKLILEKSFPTISVKSFISAYHGTIWQPPKINL